MFLAHIHLEIADVTGDIIYLGIGHGFNVWMVICLNHHGRENAGRAVIGRKGFIKLGHDAADGWPLFNQVGFVPHIGQFNCSTDPCNAATDDQGSISDRHKFIHQGLKASGLSHGGTHNLYGLCSGSIRVMPMHPAALIADIGHFKQIFV